MEWRNENLNSKLQITNSKNQIPKLPNLTKADKFKNQTPNHKIYTEYVIFQKYSVAIDCFLYVAYCY